MKKNLVYFTLGGDPNYSQLFKKCFDTLQETCPTPSFDVVVMCDKQYTEHIGDRVTQILYTDNNRTGIDASMRKVEIMRWEHIRQYEKVLYLDSDIVVLGDLNALFEQTLEDDVLYVVPEGSPSSHMKLVYGLQDYTKDEQEYLQKNNICPFNCGQFMFKPSDAMHKHFEDVIQSIKSWKRRFFYEQSFMNRHFNMKGKLDYNILPRYVRLFPKNYNDERGFTIYHFTGCGTHFSRKLDLMESYHQEWKKQTQQTSSVVAP